MKKARYASDAQVRRCARLAGELGITTLGGLRLGADGSVMILDSRAAAALSVKPEDDPDAALEAWEAENGVAWGS